MHLFREHPYVVSLVLATLLVLAGALIVSKSSTVEPASSTTRAWGGVGTNFFDPLPGSEGLRQPQQETIYSEILAGPPFYYSQTPSPIPAHLAPADDFDFGAFLAMLSEPSAKTQVGASDPSFDAYSFIPKGLLSISMNEKERTPTEQKLYDYGNEVGSSIQTYEELHRNAPQVLRDQFEDRGDPAKNDALRELAGSMTRLGETLAAMEETPTEVASAHQRLAESYLEMGEKLSRIPDAAGEEALLSAMLSYNASVETFTKNFVALAILFSAHGVTFTDNDPGSVFTFTNTAGL